VTLPFANWSAGYGTLRDGGGLRLGKWTVPGSRAVLRSQQAVASAHHMGSLQQRGRDRVPDRSSYFSRPTVARDPTENMVRPASIQTMFRLSATGVCAVNDASWDTAASEPYPRRKLTLCAHVLWKQVSSMTNIGTKFVLGLIISQSAAKGSAESQVRRGAKGSLNPDGVEVCRGGRRQGRVCLCHCPKQHR